MAKIRRGGYIFLTWIGDHGVRHVHVYGKKGLVVKWDLDNGLVMEGKASTRVRKLITDLQKEGLL